jgi:hypothetical protein
MSPRYLLGLISVLLSLSAAGGADAQQTNEQLAARCAQLGSIADRYMRQGGEGSPGPNMARMGAGLDCSKGRYEQGIKALEKLLSGQRIPFPPG